MAPQLPDECVADPDLCAALVFWARGRDPILRRYAVGSLARSLTSSAANYGKVKSTGGLMALAGSLTVEDGQTQCYAAAAIGALCCCAVLCLHASIRSKPSCACRSISRTVAFSGRREAMSPECNWLLCREGGSQWRPDLQRPDHSLSAG